MTVNLGMNRVGFLYENNSRLGAIEHARLVRENREQNAIYDIDTALP